MTVNEVLDAVMADKAFYKSSGGGVTCSGGEPLLQAGFVAELLEKAKGLGVRTAVDTAGNVPFEAFERVLPYTDLLLYDIKHMDSDKHKEGAGAGNETVLRNLERVAGGADGQNKAYPPVWIRVPIVPGFNDTIENMEATAEFVSRLPAVQKLELLPYHNLGSSKFQNLGLPFSQNRLTPPDKERIEALAAPFAGRDYELVK